MLSSRFTLIALLLIACGSGTPTGPGGTAGTGGTGGTRDDPFGVGPTDCDSNPGVGGDACAAFLQSAGFRPSPAHLSSNQPATVEPAIEIAFEFSPTTALKRAMEEGVTLGRSESGVVVATQNRWIASREAKTLSYILAPVEPLAAGGYWLSLPRAAWLEFSKAYSARYTSLPPFRTAEFPQLPNGDLRSEFRVGP
jgi:hypothetical protein